MSTQFNQYLESSPLAKKLNKALKLQCFYGESEAEDERMVKTIKALEEFRGEDLIDAIFNQHDLMMRFAAFRSLKKNKGTHDQYLNNLVGKSVACEMKNSFEDIYQKGTACNCYQCVRTEMACTKTSDVSQQKIAKNLFKLQSKDARLEYFERLSKEEQDMFSYFTLF